MAHDEKAPPYDSLAVPSLGRTRRRSMEYEEMPLPPGWIRQFDTASHHHFYVDTTANPPRTIWDHPYEDPEYLRSIGHHESGLGSGSEDEHEKIKDRKREPSPNPAGASSSRALPDQQPQQPKSPGFFSQVLNFMEQRYLQRRQVFQQGPMIPTSMAGPMYPATAVMYAPPLFPFGRCHERREARRDRRAIRRAIRRGYAVPAGMASPLVGQPIYEAPLFGYGVAPNRW